MKTVALQAGSNSKPMKISLIILFSLIGFLIGLVYCDLILRPLIEEPDLPTDSQSVGVSDASEEEG